MLLPSAFPCDGIVRPSSVIHPSSASTYASSPMNSRHRRTISSDIYTTCCALQNRLSANMSQSSFCSLRSPTLLPSPSIIAGTKSSSAKPPGAKQASKKPSGEREDVASTRGWIPQEPPRSIRKRRRSVSDDEARNSANVDVGNAPSTPKRQRMAPLSLPLGLQREDFDGLSQSPPADQISCNRLPDAVSAPVIKPFSRANTPSRAQPKLTPSTYSSSLASLIIDKLSLREEAFPDLEPNTGNVDDRWRSWVSAAEMAKGRRIRREMVIRRGGRRERKGLDGIW